MYSRKIKHLRSRSRKALILLGFAGLDKLDSLAIIGTMEQESVKQFSIRTGLNVETIRILCRKGMPHHMDIKGAVDVVYIVHVKDALAWIEAKRAKLLEAAKK